MKSKILFCLYLYLIALFPTTLHAHKLAPSLLALHEQKPNVYAVTWKTPQALPDGVVLAPILPEECTKTSHPRRFIEGTGVVSNWQISCEIPLHNLSFSVVGLSKSRTAALLRIEWLGGEKVKAMLIADKPVYKVPEHPEMGRIALDYMQLGVEHILSGLDHLLFVLGLIILVSGRRLLIWTITAFTVGHSITLALAALGYVRYPVDLVEFAIAGSIFVVALELTRLARDKTWLRGKPWLVTVIFGLLHGMGFAGGLLEVGLPSSDIPLALLVFNIGIEVGQLLFIVAVLSSLWLLNRFNLLQHGWLKWIPVYTIGSMSAFWCIERAIPIFQ